MPLMPWWAPAVLALTYVAATFILRLIPKSPPRRPKRDS